MDSLFILLSVLSRCLGMVLSLPLTPSSRRSHDTWIWPQLSLVFLSCIAPPWSRSTAGQQHVEFGTESSSRSFWRKHRES
jgi:hypothetical protein